MISIAYRAELAQCPVSFPFEIGNGYFSFFATLSLASARSLRKLSFRPCCTGPLMSFILDLTQADLAAWGIDEVEKAYSRRDRWLD